MVGYANVCVYKISSFYREHIILLYVKDSHLESESQQ